MSRKVRIGVIGAGANTRTKHIPGFKAIDGVEVVAVCNRTRESGEKVAKESDIGRVCENWREIIESPDVDAVCIGTWPNMHARLTIAALRAGKHVLTEARMARNLAEAEAMYAESQANPNLVAQIVPAPMSLPFDETIKRMLAAGEIGDLREICVTCTNGGFASAEAPLTWRQDFSLSGKNTLFMGIYYEMVLRWIGTEPDSVIADAGVFTAERVDDAGVKQRVGIPESITILGSYRNGARLIAHFSGVEPGSPRNEIRLNGSTGSLRLDLAKGELSTAKIVGAETRVEIPLESRGEWRVEADFIDSIRDKKPVALTDFATGVRYMRFTEAVWGSWSAGGARTPL